MNNEHLLTALLRHLRLRLPQAATALLFNLALMVLALAQSPNCHLATLATVLPLEGQRENLIQRLRRWLSAPQLTWECYYRPLVRQFLASWPGVELALVIDRTDLNDRLSLLFVGIATHQRVVLLAWEVLPYGNTDAETQLTLLKRLVPLLPSPSQVRISFFGDAEFRAVELQRFCQQQCMISRLRGSPELLLMMVSVWVKHTDNVRFAACWWVTLRHSLKTPPYKWKTSTLNQQNVGRATKTGNHTRGHVDLLTRNGLFITLDDQGGKMIVSLFEDGIPKPRPEPASSKVTKSQEMGSFGILMIKYCEWGTGQLSSPDLLGSVGMECSIEGGSMPIEEGDFLRSPKCRKSLLGSFGILMICGVNSGRLHSPTASQSYAFCLDHQNAERAHVMWPSPLRGHEDSKQHSRSAGRLEQWREHVGVSGLRVGGRCPR
jgi:hypothetical protein